MNQQITCFELNRPDRMILAAARMLYENTLDHAERIPWTSLERPIWGKAIGEIKSWNQHLILAGETEHPNDLLGYLAATYLPGFGGYVSYMGVHERSRGKGVGRLLYEKAFEVLKKDAELVDEELSFVIWESHSPDEDESIENWQARAKLFDRLGACWIDGIELWSPDYSREYSMIPYQLFLKPFGKDGNTLRNSAHSELKVASNKFSPGRLRKIVHDHYRRVYFQKPGGELYDRTFAIHPSPRLRPAIEASEILAYV
jgi:GNAT superfamily N-acetyltransferase